MKLVNCKSALNLPPVVYSTDRSKAVVPVLVLLFVALWFILRDDLFYVLPCVILFLCFSDLLALRLPRLGKRELILVFFVRLFDLRLFGFVCFLFLLVSELGCGLLFWHSLDFSLTFFHVWRLFLHCLFLISVFGASGGLCFVSLAFPGYLHLYFASFLERYILLTDLCLASYKWDFGKQWRPRSDAAERGVWSGSTLFSLSTGIYVQQGNNKS